MTLEKFGHIDALDRAIGEQAFPYALRDRVAGAQKLGELGSHAANCDGNDTIAFVKLQAPTGRAAEMVGIFENGVEYRGEVAAGIVDHAQDIGGRGLPLQRFLGLVEQPRILDGDDGLVGKALLQRKLFLGKGKQPVAVDDENTDRLAFAPKRGTAHGAGAGRAGMRRARPVGHRRMDVVEIRDVNLAIFGNHGARQIRPPDPDGRQRNRRANLYRAIAEAECLSPLAVLDEL